MARVLTIGLLALTLVLASSWPSRTEHDASDSLVPPHPTTARR